MNQKIQVQCTRCHEPMTIEFDSEWMSEEKARKIAACDRCLRHLGVKLPKREPQTKEQPEFKLPYKDL